MITTETGLVIALAGLFFSHRLGRTLECYTAFIAQMETVCTQSLHNKLMAEAYAGESDTTDADALFADTKQPYVSSDIQWDDFETCPMTVTTTLGSTSHL